MREDFGRLVIERERRGSSNRGLKIRKTGKFHLKSDDWGEWDYDGPLKIRTNGIHGIKHAYDRKIGEKGFSDVLRPVFGYLHQSVGRLWNDVHSELTESLGRGTYPIRHVLEQHTLREVATNTYLENGKVYAGEDGYSYGSSDYFVDPRDGTLREEVDRPRYRYRKPTYDRHHWKDGLWFVWIRGVWYLGSYTKNANLATDTPHRPWKEERPSHERNWAVIEREKADYVWPNIEEREKKYFVKWRQAGKKDLRS